MSGSAAVSASAASGANKAAITAALAAIAAASARRPGAPHAKRGIEVLNAMRRGDGGVLQCYPLRRLKEAAASGPF